MQETAKNTFMNRKGASEGTLGLIGEVFGLIISLAFVPFVNNAAQTAADNSSGIGASLYLLIPFVFGALIVYNLYKRLAKK